MKMSQNGSKILKIVVWILLGVLMINICRILDVLYRDVGQYEQLKKNTIKILK